MLLSALVLANSLYNFVRRGVKKRILYGQADRKRLSPPPLRSALLWFFWCSFDLILWLCVFWNGFYTRKSQFSSNYWNPQFLLLLLLPSGSSFASSRPPFWQPRKGHEKCIFETPLNEIKCVLSKNQISVKKKDRNFQICLWSGPTGLTAHSPLGRDWP